MESPFKGKKPAPFRRKGVRINESHNREWRWIAPNALSPGDVLKDFGRIERILDYGLETEIFHDIRKGETIFANNKHTVYAFTLIK